MGALFASNSCTTACSPVDPPPVGPGGWMMKRIWAPAGAGFVMVIDSGCVKVCGGQDWSNATTVKLNVPVCVGVPLITPCKSMASPGGKVLEVGAMNIVPKPPNVAIVAL